MSKQQKADILQSLYNDSWNNKWKEIEEEVKNSNWDYVFDTVFENCDFCDYAQNILDITSIGATGRVCGDECPIDKKICGSETSKIAELSSLVFNDEKRKKQIKIIKQIVRYMKKKAQL